MSADSNSEPAAELQVCRTCGTNKPLSEYYFRKDNQKYRTECKDCWGKKTAAWAKNNIERSREIKMDWQRRNPGNLKKRKAAYRKRNPIGYRRWNLENPDLVKKINREWAAKNKPKRAAQAAARRSKKRLATPPWANQEIVDFYYSVAAERGLEVDHIVPLGHRLVCGLHCDRNLQLLPMSANRRKSNCYWPDMP